MRTNMQVIAAVVLVGALAVACSSGKAGPAGGGAAGSGGSAVGGAAGSAGSSGSAGSAPTPGQDAGQCAKVAIADCASTAGCEPLYARRIYTNCLGARTEVGCGAPGCGSTITRATDPNGKDWRFSSTCIPAGWTNMTMQDVELPQCSDAGAGAGGSADAGP